MRFTIEHEEAERQSFGHYLYRIRADGQLVARYWHDYRGGEHGIEFADGTKEPWPVGRMLDFIEGGGPQPLTLSARATAYLEQKLR